MSGRRVQKPCANPAGMNSWCQFSALRTAATHLPYVGDPWRRSTATSKAALGNAYELGLLRGLDLKMQPANNAGLARERMVVLHKVDGDAVLPQVATTVGLRKEAARILMSHRFHEDHVGDRKARGF